MVSKSLKSAIINGNNIDLIETGNGLFYVAINETNIHGGSDYAEINIMFRNIVHAMLNRRE